MPVFAERAVILYGHGVKGSAMAVAGKRQSDIEPSASAGADFRRGACPTLAAPMATGDGLLVRLRPEGGALTLAQFNALARSAAANGNGLLEITARGNLQIRGLSAASAGNLASDIDAAGIVVPASPAIELSPLHGIDPNELGDAASFEAMLREKLGRQLASPLLAPKLSIVIDGRGRFCLDHLSADIRAVAIGNGHWIVAIDGIMNTAVQVYAGPVDGAIEAAGTLLELLISAGRHSRSRDIEPTAIHAAFPMGDEHSVSAGARPQPGIFTLADGQTVLGLRPRFGQMKAEAALAFLAAAEATGATEIRLAPDRQFFVIGLAEREAHGLDSAAHRYGLTADPADPSVHIAACAGAGACASGFYPTKVLAEGMLARVPALFDGSLDVHFSGCAKGCAHPDAALTLTGTPDGYSLVLDGRAGDVPDVTIAGGGIDFAIEKLAQLAGTHRQAGESVADCLRRLGAATIAKALRQE